MFQKALAPATISAVLLASSADMTFAQARVNGPYIGLAIGAVDLNDAETDLNDIEFDTGYAVGGRFGYQFDYIRLEGELDFQFTEGTSISGVNADVDITRFTGSAYVDLPTGGQVVPYVGGGLGGASLSTSGGFDDEDTAFTWHGEAGVAITLTDQFSIIPAYRYQWIDTDLGNQTDPLTGNLFTVSLRYVFNAPNLTVGGAPAYRSPYDSYPGSYYRRPYYYDPFYRRGYPDRPDPPSRRERERDRCGWDGPDCPPDAEGWDG